MTLISLFLLVILWGAGALIAASLRELPSPWKSSSYRV